jgi:hypothetical protein
MNQEDIIRMAKEAGVKPMLFDGKWAIDNLDKFAALIAEAEREECAKVCENNHDLIADSLDGYEIAAAIRERGNSEQ